MSETTLTNEQIQYPGSRWIALLSLVGCIAALGFFLVGYLGLAPIAACKALGALYFLCLAPGYLLQCGLFRLTSPRPFEGLLSAFLLGLLITPLVWYALCWMDAKWSFLPLVLLCGTVTPVAFGWHRLALRRRKTGPRMFTAHDTPILWLAVAVAMLWSYSLSVVELRDDQAFIMPHGDHSLHVALIGELARGVPAEALPFVAGAKKWAYHDIPDVWCDLVRRATGTDAETAYFHIALPLRYVFLSLACYLALVHRFGRPAALVGVVFTLAVVGYAGHPREAMFSNSLLFYLHSSYPSAFGLVTVFLTTYYVSLIDSADWRVPLLLGSILSVVLLWYKANFALVVAPAVALVSIITLARRRDYRWLLACIGTMIVLASIRQWQLSSADFGQPFIMRPLLFLVWWWDNIIKMPQGWPTTALDHVRLFVERLPSALQWPAVLAVCMIHRFHVGLIAVAFLILGCARTRGGSHRDPAAQLTLLILLFIVVGFVCFPVVEWFTGNVSAANWSLSCALLFPLVGVIVYRTSCRMFRRGRFVAVATSVVLLAAAVANVYALRTRAVWQTRVRHDAISQDLYACYQHIKTSTPNTAVILEPRYTGWTTAGMLTQRRIVLERDDTWRYFYDTTPIRAHVERFYGQVDPESARAILGRYGVDYVVADLSTGWQPPSGELLTMTFRQGDAAVYQVKRDTLASKLID
ncbi:MAG: hypothetical protein JSU63_21950 [Phycisphaerales bacterium]|nr:MAG: hypothetical protein JSU63_21950 [Phycisphaerales bacterium]